MKRKNEQSTRELMGTKELSDYSIRTYRKCLHLPMQNCGSRW